MMHIKPLIWKRLECWKAGYHCALVKEVEDAALEDGWGTAGGAPFNVESAVSNYVSMSKSGKIRAAVRIATGCNIGGLYRPYDKCTT